MGSVALVERTGETDRRMTDYASLLGAAAWHRLPAAVRQRFSTHARADAPTTYRGRMTVRASAIGRCFAWLGCLMGTPIAPYVGNDVPIEVRVFDRDDGGGTVWERRYCFTPARAVTVTSTKQLSANGELHEVLSSGLNMRLRVFEQNGTLNFVSEEYFLRIGERHIRLPSWLPPGITHVTHEDLGRGRFRFTMRTAHPWWGEMFFQSGVFA